MGADVAVIGRVGDDDFGRRFLDALDAEGLDRAGVSVDPHTGTGVAAIVVDATGENAILQSPRANRNITADDVRRAAPAIERAHAAVFQLELSDDAARAYATIARAADATVIFNPAPAGAFAEDLLGLTDVIVPNQIEARSMTGLATDTVEEAFAAAGALRQRGPRAAIITMGADGAVAVSDDVRLHAPAFAVDVIDSVGAGDAFCAALALRLAIGDALHDAVRYANAAGAFACTRHGAEPSMPRTGDVESVLRGGRA
jgi:ribokinase